METQPYLLEISIARFAESYQVELSHIDPTSDARVAPLRGYASFDLQKLTELQGMDPDYGNALAAQLFAESALKERFRQVETAAAAASNTLRVSLRIDPSAQELLALRWELLRHPDNAACLTTSEKLLFSRFMVSRDFRPVKLRGRTELTALIAVSAPVGEQWDKKALPPVDFAREVEGVKKALGSIQVRTLGGPGDPFTLPKLLQALRAGVDILYVVSHGMFAQKTGTPALFLQDESEDVAVVKEEFASRIGDLSKPPRLVVLASCQSAGDGESQGGSPRVTAQATLAGRLADAGIPAVIAMQGYISMTTVKAMMPVFFAELLRDGRVDRALAVARAHARDRRDFWMPALYTRLNTCQVWYTPGFRGADGDAVWSKLVQPARDGKLVPILGPGLLADIHGTSFEIARELANAKHFPLGAHEVDDLPRVTQFLSVNESRYNVLRSYQEQLRANLLERNKERLSEQELASKPKLPKLFGLVADQHLQKGSDAGVYNMLAKLPASVYVNTTFDPLLLRALRAHGKEPRQLISRWRYKKAPASEVAAPGCEPSARAPLVYHAFGAFGKDTEDSLVLTEDDYFDYLIGMAPGGLIPAEVQSALVDNSLLFLGFRLTDWSFRVLFRFLRSLPGRDRLKHYCHVGVQIDPELHTMADVERAKAYLRKYFHDEAQVEIYWGNSEEFLTRLHQEIAAAGRLSQTTSQENEGQYDWT